MLIDDILSTKEITNILSDRDLNMMKARLAKATKFILAADFAATAENLSMDFGAIAKAIPYCRLPYPSIWFEVAQQERPVFAASSIHIPELQKAPKRVGFLLEQENDLGKFIAHQFWIFPNGTISSADLAMVFDPSKVRQDQDTSATGKAHQIFDIESSPMWRTASPLVRSILTTALYPTTTHFIGTMHYIAEKYKGVDVATTREWRFAFEVAVTDWSGEAVFLLAILALLNTVNAQEKVLVTQPSLNKARLKSGKQPLQDHYLLKIHTDLRKKYGSNTSGNHRDLRFHLVRGHWKVRKTGVFHWHPHARGDKTKGKIQKDYEVHTHHED